MSDHVVARGRALFAAACWRDLEGIVAKWAQGTNQRGLATSWLKIKNSNYSEPKGGASCFAARRQ